MEIFWGLVGIVFGGILATLAKYRYQDKIEAKWRKEAARQYIQGYLLGKQRRVAEIQPKTAKCIHCGKNHHSSYCED